MPQTSPHFFVLNLTYMRQLAEVDSLLDAHVSYLKSAYERGSFLLTGRKEPRIGGMILARATSQDALQSIITEDPFLKEGVATYEVIEFLPSRSIVELAAVLPKRSTSTLDHDRETLSGRDPVRVTP